MFKRNLILVWIGILCLASVIFMGQQPWGPATPTPAPVPKTGQTVRYATGDDGDLQMGVTWPDPRFTDNGNGTVTDNLTSLIWTKDADCDGTTKTWSQAINYCNAMAAGTCGLSDGSVAGDWRLTNLRELQSLIYYGNYGPALPTGHPFTDVVGHWYWSSTTCVWDTGLAWGVNFYIGGVLNDVKGYDGLAHCVRGGQ